MTSIVFRNARDISCIDDDCSNICKKTYKTIKVL